MESHLLAAQKTSLQWDCQVFFRDFVSIKRTIHCQKIGVASVLLLRTPFILFIYFKSVLWFEYFIFITKAFNLQLVIDKSLLCTLKTSPPPLPSYAPTLKHFFSIIFLKLFFINFFNNRHLIFGWCDHVYKVRQFN